ncbi:MAG: hypothetical protein AAF389_04130 [Gemmatimonadota bacterium]
MNFGFSSERNRADELGVDVELGRALESLDPAQRDANYWLRFRGQVLQQAARELSRRRMVAQLTVQDVMTSWSRTLVPSALLAAAVAGVALIRPAAPMVGEQIVVEVAPTVPAVPVELAPVLLSPDEAAGLVAFAASDEF